MSVGQAVGRLVEFRQLQGGLQAEAARALLSRYRDGGLEGLLGGRGIVWIALQQEIAVQAMNESQVPSIFDLIRVSQSFFDPGKRTFDS